LEKVHYLDFQLIIAFDLAFIFGSETECNTGSTYCKL